jgi:hypothetical protein
MSLWDRIRGLGRGGYRESRARALERAGDLAGALERYLDARLPEEAARLQLLRADAEPRVAERLALLRSVATLAPGGESAKAAAARAARLRYELLRGRGAVMKSETIAAAEELLASGEARLAAEAFAEAGDREREIAALVQAGALQEVEEKLDASAARARSENALGLAARTIQDLDRTGERRKALALAAQHPGDATIRELARSIEQRLLRGPIVELVIEGHGVTVALGDVVTVGRGDATCVVPSLQVSRVHLEILRDASGAPVVRDTGGRNGTFLGGARVAGELPVGEGLSLALGGEIPCRVSPAEAGAVVVEVAGLAVHAPLGPLETAVGALVLSEGGVVELRRSGSPAYLGTLEAAPRIELALGDAVSSERGGPSRLAVAATARGARTEGASGKERR